MWRQVHIVGKAKGGEKPNRAEIDSILKAGGARIVDSAEAASADLAIVHSSLTCDHTEVCLRHTPFQHEAAAYLPSQTIVLPQSCFFDSTKSGFRQSVLMSALSQRLPSAYAAQLAVLHTTREFRLLSSTSG